jgi:hypothetical protein
MSTTKPITALTDIIDQESNCFDDEIDFLFHIRCDIDDDASCASSDMYGTFSVEEHTEYGYFDEIINECVCGTDICDVHPCNRSSGLYDPEDYNDDAEYCPMFEDKLVVAPCMEIENYANECVLKGEDEVYLDKLYNNT